MTEDWPHVNVRNHRQTRCALKRRMERHIRPRMGAVDFGRLAARPSNAGPIRGPLRLDSAPSHPSPRCIGSGHAPQVTRPAAFCTSGVCPSPAVATRKRHATRPPAPAPRTVAPSLQIRCDRYVPPVVTIRSGVLDEQRPGRGSNAPRTAARLGVVTRRAAGPQRVGCPRFGGMCTDFPATYACIKRRFTALGRHIAP